MVRPATITLWIDKHAHYKKGEYQSKILDLAIIAEADSHFRRGVSAPAVQRMASENVPGTVLLAANNIAAVSYTHLTLPTSDLV